MAVLAAVLLASAQLASAYVDLGQECPGNLLTNGGFEEPNTEQVSTHLPQTSSNSKWAWYEKIPGEHCTPMGGATNQKGGGLHKAAAAGYCTPAGNACTSHRLGVC